MNYAEWFTVLPLPELERALPPFRYPVLSRNDTGFGDRVRTTAPLVPPPVQTRKTPLTYYEKFDAWAVIQSKIRLR